MSKQAARKVGSDENSEGIVNPVLKGRDKKYVDFELSINELLWTEKQKQFFELFNDKTTKMILLSSPAGCGKTLVSIYCALQELKKKRMEKLIFVRSAVESADTKLLALPGGISEKMFPFFIPLWEKLAELLPPNQVKNLIRDEFIEAIPISYLRGRSFKSNCITVADECQSMTAMELRTLLTRIGEYSKCILIFDPMQSDLPEVKAGAMQKLFETFDDEESREAGVKVFSFDESDIKRSELVRFIVKKLNIYNN